MTLWKFLLSGALFSTFALQPALAGHGGSAIEVVTFKLKAGVAAAEFAPIDKAVEREHVARQPGFVSRESAHGAWGRLRLAWHSNTCSWSYPVPHNKNPDRLATQKLLRSIWPSPSLRYAAG